MLESPEHSFDPPALGLHQLQCTAPRSRAGRRRWVSIFPTVAFAQPCGRVGTLARIWAWRVRWGRGDDVGEPNQWERNLRKVSPPTPSSNPRGGAAAGVQSR